MSRVGQPDQAAGNMSVLADDGCRLWTAETGLGAALIICHGGPGLWDMSGTLAVTLALDLRVIRWDQRGCGRSERRGPFSLGRSAADLDAVRRGLGLDRIAVLGHSWGATLGLRYALDYPERVTALIYVSGTGLGWAWQQPFQRNITARLAPHRRRLGELRARDRTEAEDRELAVLQWSAEFTGPDAMRHAEQMATPWFGVNHDCYADIWSELKRTWHEPELVAACRKLAVPVLIIDGAADLRPRRAVDSLEQALPDVSRVVLPGVSHVPWLDAPADFSAALLNYLRALVQPGRDGNRTFRAKLGESSTEGQVTGGEQDVLQPGARLLPGEQPERRLLPGQRHHAVALQVLG